MQKTRFVRQYIILHYGGTISYLIKMYGGPALLLSMFWLNHKFIDGNNFVDVILFIGLLSWTIQKMGGRVLLTAQEAIDQINKTTEEEMK